MKCEKCGCNIKDSNYGYINPIDEEGKDLERVVLCFKCFKRWKKVYKSSNVGRYVYGWKFHRGWAKLWKRFMRGNFDREEVEFT